nr:SseB family protein [Naasia aerilata]
MVTVAGPDGRTVLPAFTSVDAMRAWNPKARPIPAESERIALAAAAEGTDLLVLDPLSDTEFVLRRPAVEALGRGTPGVRRPRTPSWSRSSGASPRSPTCSDCAC